MSNEQEPIPEKPSRQERQINNIWSSLRKFFKELLDIRSNTDHEESLKTIRADIPLVGHTVWILIFAIVIASVGLNVNSPAVVIGAMLISPLMGPIMGLGMGTAINDSVMLRRSLRNLAVMIGVSVFTSYIYFLLSPLKEITPELEARTYPTLLDVLVAISGGLALIVARTKKGTILSVIVGVAIATALMPPLCTAGYGLARLGEAPEALNYFLGAMFLFSINTVYIALSAYAVAKLLRFPMTTYADPKKRRRTSTIASIIGIAVLALSINQFYNFYQEQIFISEAKSFVKEMTKEVKYSGAYVPKSAYTYEPKSIELYVFGRVLNQDILNEMEDKLKSYENLGDAKLIINQGEKEEVNKSEIESAYITTIDQLNNAESEITSLKNEIQRLRTQGYPINDVFNEAQGLFPKVKSIGFSEKVVSNFETIDTIPICYLDLDPKLRKTEKAKEEERITNWLKIRLKLDTLVVFNPQ